MLIRSCFLSAVLLWSMSASAVPWLVASRGSIELGNDVVLDVNEMSGIAYVGPNGTGLHRFLAVQDSGNRLVTIDLGINPNGSLSSASAVSTLALSPGHDFEGIVYNGAAENSVYLSEEDTPGVRAYNLTTGMETASLAIPAVFSHRRANRGFESLTRDSSASVLWTANEEALTIDGPTATTTDGTYVRLQQFVEGGGSATAGAQFAYYVEPIHTGTTVNSNTRSGLVDLVALPDGTLLSLERSLAVGLPPYWSSIYELDFTGATDVSASQFDGGLVGQTFTPVSKTLLWSGPAGESLGQNLEGLALGPQLPNSHWTLVGVVDNGDGLSGNTILSFEIAPPGCGPIGDYDCNQMVDDADHSVWMNQFSGMAPISADGNRDGFVDAADYALWRDHTAGSTGTSAVAVPEPSAMAWGFVLLAASCLPKQKAAAPTRVRRPWKVIVAAGRPERSVAGPHGAG